MRIYESSGLSVLTCDCFIQHNHYTDAIMGAMASQITSIYIVYSTFYSGAHQRKHQSSASLAFVRGIHRWPVNSPHKWPVTRKPFTFDDVIMMKHVRWNQGSYIYQSSNVVVYLEGSFQNHVYHSCRESPPVVRSQIIQWWSCRGFLILQLRLSIEGFGQLWWTYCVPP